MSTETNSRPDAYQKLELKYEAMKLIALSGAGIPVDVLNELHPDDDEAWKAARQEASIDYLSLEAHVLNKHGQ